MSESLPGYDAWKLASPPYLDDDPPCTCGHDILDHTEYSGCMHCPCEDYREYTRDDWEDDMRERRAEARANW